MWFAYSWMLNQRLGYTVWPSIQRLDRLSVKPLDRWSNRVYAILVPKSLNYKEDRPTVQNITMQTCTSSKWLVNSGPLRGLQSGALRARARNVGPLWASFALPTVARCGQPALAQYSSTRWHVEGPMFQADWGGRSTSRHHGNAGNSRYVYFYLWFVVCKFCDDFRCSSVINWLIRVQ